VAWDGTGHGEDGTIWGGEFLTVNDSCYRRAAHLLPFRLPGGEAAVRDPNRAALGALYAVHGEALWATDDLTTLAAFKPPERDLLQIMLAHGLNSPLTSSAGRLFDVVAAILGLCAQTSFEGQAAMAVEFAAGRAENGFAFPLPLLTEDEERLVVDWRPMLKELTRALRGGVSPKELAAGFHAWLAMAIVSVARQIGIESIVLTGGCFQNALLAELATERLRARGFRVFRHRRVPPGDGGLAVGQAAFAARAMLEEKGVCALQFPASS
jgi:hydrogenase maturation protein HypF